MCLFVALWIIKLVTLACISSGFVLIAKINTLWDIVDYKNRTCELVNVHVLIHFGLRAISENSRAHHSCVEKQEECLVPSFRPFTISNQYSCQILLCQMDISTFSWKTKVTKISFDSSSELIVSVPNTDCMSYCTVISSCARLGIVA